MRVLMRRTMRQLNVEATARVFLEILRRQILPPDKTGLNGEELEAFQKQNPDPIEAIGLNVEPYQPLQGEAAAAQTTHISTTQSEGEKAKGRRASFCPTSTTTVRFPF